MESGLYYVSSRYYDPEIGRFINADNQIAGVGGEVLGYNMFAYCMNNPVNMSDPTGDWPSWSNLLKGSAWLAVGITAVCVGVSVLTCFDAAHFGGSPYWVISSAKNGTIKIMMP